MTSLARTTAIAIAAAMIGTAAFAAEACCCKDGEKMACCDKMKDHAPAKPGESKPGQAKPAQPEHQH